MNRESRRILVSLDDQIVRVVENGAVLATFPVSTAAKGMGFREGSFRTPTGRFRICGKFGEGSPEGTVFRGREPVGLQEDAQQDGDRILSRVLWLDGQDDANRNTRGRFIYIHGTNREEQLGQPASRGGVRMAPGDVIRLFDMVPDGSEVEILPAKRRRGKLCFIDCDSTLSSIEGIDELARARGQEIFTHVENLTRSAMDGDLPIAEVFPRRMESIRPDRTLCDHIARAYLDTMVEGAEGLVSDLIRTGWTPVVLSGGFAPLIVPLARRLGIDHVEAVPIHFDANGGYAGYGEDYPTTRNLGKNEIIREWMAAMLPERVVMIGDGVSDLETRTEVDLFVGFGGVVERRKVRDGCDFWLADMSSRDLLLEAMENADFRTSGR